MEYNTCPCQNRSPFTDATLRSHSCSIQCPMQWRLTRDNRHCQQRGLIEFGDMEKSIPLRRVGVRFISCSRVVRAASGYVDVPVASSGCKPPSGPVRFRDTREIANFDPSQAYTSPVDVIVPYMICKRMVILCT